MSLTLRDYQREDVEFLKALDQGACFNEQRTGKTPTILTVIKERGFNKVLILCPPSMLFVWQREYKLWTGQDCQVYAGTPKKREEALASWIHGLVMSYDLFRRPEQVTRFRKMNIDCLILDEAHRIRNRKTQTAKAVFAMRHVPYKYVLTGTPSVNRGEDVWSLLHLLFPEKYSSYWRFINEHFDTANNFTMLPSGKMQSYTEIIGYKLGHKKVIQEILNTFATNKKRKDTLNWNTEKEYIDIRLPLTRDQRTHLKNLEKYFETERLVVRGTLDRITRYRQICLDPRILDLKGSKSPKLEWVRQYIHDYPDQGVLIFSNFTSYLEQIRKLLGAVLIGGKTPARDRIRHVENFQRGETNVLCLNTKAASEGLTLDRAEAAIFLDVFPPWGTQMQAEDRFLPTTAARAGKQNTVFKLIMEDSYDEEIVKLMEHRESMTTVINNFNKYLGGE